MENIKILHTRIVSSNGTEIDAGKQAARRDPKQTPIQQKTHTNGIAISGPTVRIHCHINIVLYKLGATERQDPPERGLKSSIAPTEL
ncbi:unnamed protein product [Rotaria sp. Silwood1]|nr:unnamed protein product [Rotaria sp. Silwood1]